jgi:hypothetical protein
MALINTTTTGVLGSTFVADGTGDLTIQQNGVTINKITATPAFRVYKNAFQSISNSTFTKVTLPIKSFDVTSSFDSATNHRFQPNIPGYYQGNGKIVVTSTQTISRLIVSIRLNGVESNFYGRGFDLSNNQAFAIANISELFYLNGTTDYLELWVWVASSGTINVASDDSNTSAFSGFLARAA